MSFSGPSIRTVGVASIDFSSQSSRSSCFIIVADTDVAFQILKDQQDRDDKIRALLSTMVDMLGFVDAVDACSNIQKLQDTVSSMMDQIRECAVFIQQYCGIGLFSGYRPASVPRITDLIKRAF